MPPAKEAASAAPRSKRAKTRDTAAQPSTAAETTAEPPEAVGRRSRAERQRTRAAAAANAAACSAPVGGTTAGAEEEEEPSPPPPQQQQQRQPPKKRRARLTSRADAPDPAPAPEEDTPAAAVPAPAPAEPPSTPSPAVEPDAVIVDGVRIQPLNRSSAAGASGDTGGRGSGSALARIDFLRIRVSDAATGTVRLETRIPAGFVDGLASIVPAVAGLDLQGIARAVSGDPGWTRDRPVFDTNAGADRIHGFVE